MAKKIVIKFNSNPAGGYFCKYDILFDGSSIIYANGLPTDGFFFAVTTDPLYYYTSELGVSVASTVTKAMSFFTTKWINTDVTYTQTAFDTIEILLSNFVDVIVDDFFTNAALTITVEDNPTYLNNIKYYIEFEDWRLNIYKHQYTGSPIEVYGRMQLKKSTAKEALDVFRGTGLTVDLEANQALTFDELAIEPEGTFICKLLKSGNIRYNGILKPDGIYQSFVQNEWRVSIDFVDGLGLIKDLSFVKPNGLHYVNKMSVFEIIEACLRRTKIQMPIHIYCRVYYTGYVGTTILNDVYLNSSRFIKTDNNTIMSCDEVLKSVLDIFSMVITQENGRWYIYRPNDLINKVVPTFLIYPSGVGSPIPLLQELGSQVNGFYPHHCNGNQEIYVNGAISAYRLNYKYGFLSGYLENKYLEHDLALDFAGWTVDNSSYIVNDPQDFTGLKTMSKVDTGGDPLRELLVSEPVSILEGDVLRLDVKMRTQYFKAQYVYRIKSTDGLWWVNSLGEWVSVASGMSVVAGYDTWVFGNSFTDSEHSFNIAPAPADLDIEVSIFTPFKLSILFFTIPILCEVTYIDLINVSLYDGKVGEFHTIQRKNAKSSIAKENDIVFNGDSISGLFVGAIYKEDAIELTDTWYRENIVESKPILQISAEDDMRIQQKPAKQFKGDIYGYFPYLCMFTIDNITGIFSPIEWAYDINNNITKATSIEVFEGELDDFDYTLTYDYGNTVKPTIVG